VVQRKPWRFYHYLWKELENCKKYQIVKQKSAFLFVKSRVDFQLVSILLGGVDECVLWLSFAQQKWGQRYILEWSS
jgi:hypothetical protein